MKPFPDVQYMTDADLAKECLLLMDWLELDHATAISASDMTRRVSQRLQLINEEMGIREVESDDSLGGTSDYLL